MALMESVLRWIADAETTRLREKLTEMENENELSPRDTETRAHLRAAIRKELAQRDALPA